MITSYFILIYGVLLFIHYYISLSFQQTQDNVARKEEHFAESPSKPSLKPRPDASASHHRQAYDHGSNPRVAQSHAHANYSNPSPMSQQQQHLIQPPAIYQVRLVA